MIVFMVLGVEFLFGANAGAAWVWICIVIGYRALTAVVLASVMLIVRMLFATSYAQLKTGSGTKSLTNQLNLAANSAAKLAPIIVLRVKRKDTFQHLGITSDIDETIVIYFMNCAPAYG